MPDLRIDTTAIPGLLVVQLPLHGDARGWLKENWQRTKMIALGLPDFGPVQQTMSLNAYTGVTRGLHAEPWDKYVSVGSGSVYGAWVDLRDAPTFGTAVHFELTPDKAVFVPRGVANSFQTLQPDTVYSYLVNDHWSQDALGSYTYLNLADETVAIPWPISLDQAELSPADREHPRLGDVRPMPAKQIRVFGANGQLGKAITALRADADPVTRQRAELTDPASVEALPWRDIGTVINAAAYTAVDAAETPEGRRECWATNVGGARVLANQAQRHHLKLVHLSSDYVFDGRRAEHSEEEPLSPLGGAYAASKAAADEIVATLPDYLIVRTSWVVGSGNNFVRTMARLADQGVAPSVVSDQFGRLTFADDLAQAILHLISLDKAGTFNVTNSGPTTSWYEIARAIFSLRGRKPDDVSPVSSADYGTGRLLAPRPRHSTLTLSKLSSTGFTMPDYKERLATYVDSLPNP